MVVSSLPYYGGKARFAGWIAERTTVRRSYVEPFAGMASVLLARPKADSEMINDRSGIVVNWWRVVRDQPNDLMDLIEWTPLSRDVRREARQVCFADPESDVSDVRRAWAFTVLATQSVANNVTRPDSWRYQFASSVRRYRGKSILQLADRITDVQIDNRDALVVLAATADVSDIMVYCDPPYPTADTSAYFETKDTFDRSGLAAAFLAQRGHCAVSGYRDDWPELDDAGWTRHEIDVAIRVAPAGSENDRRVECLWTNFDAAQASLF